MHCIAGCSVEPHSDDVPVPRSRRKKAKKESDGTEDTEGERLFVMSFNVEIN